ncbi:hypothetical protein F2Q70_00017111 [Brassica cretica]|uniref:Uncharacterized protein n=1 Tax=Brassica cretica TaxID=69181 RepID=A0A8S9HPK9_BRACR|nr:hypothetical protein F2Q70_00017111 [Brassica cretica]
MTGKQTERNRREELVETSELPVPTEQRPAVVLHQSSDQYDKDPPTLKKSADGMVIPFSIIGGFALGYGDINSGDRSNRSKNLHRSNSSWSRRSQSKRRASQSGYGGTQNDREDGAEKVWVQCRLDRAFGNAKWFRLFPQSHTAYLEKTAPDHRPIFTSLANSGQRRTGRFMFDKRWCKKPEVTEVIRRGWCSNFASGQGSVSERIKSLQTGAL